MRQKNPNLKPSRRAQQSGQGLVEAAMILVVFLAVITATLDFGQLLFTHQMLVERVRTGLRWGMIHAWDGTGDSVANVILYDHPNPGNKRGSCLNLKRANVEVTRVAGTPADPNDLRLKVRIVDYRLTCFTPFISRSFTNNYAVVESAPILYRE
jgi:hypothetical protein